MRSRSAYPLAACALALLMSACTSNDEDTSDLPILGGVRGINALADIEDVIFRVVFEDFDPSVEVRINFQSSSNLVDFSLREYTFTFEDVFPGDTDATILAQTVGTIEPETLYEFVVAGSLDDPQLFVWTQPRRDWFQALIDAEDNGTVITELDAAFGHAAVSVGAVDVYLEAPGTSPAAATPLGTIAFGDLGPAVTIEEGTYQLVLTPEGDANTILFTSEELELIGANTVVFAVVEDAGLTTQSVGVRLINNSLSAAVSDINAGAAISVVHAVPDATAVDVYGSNDFDTALVSALAFGELSDDVALPAGEVQVAVTPADDVGVILAEETLDLPDGAYQRVFLAGSPGDVQTFVVDDDRRAFVNQGRLRAFNGAVRFETLDVFLLEPGIDLEASPTAISSLPFGGASILASIEPGEYDLVLTEVDSTNVIFGPVPLVVEGGNVFELVITDAAEATQADVTILQTASD